jgi:CRISPR type III-A-associated protein Csm2
LTTNQIRNIYGFVKQIEMRMKAAQRQNTAGTGHELVSLSRRWLTPQLAPAVRAQRYSSACCRMPSTKWVSDARKFARFVDLFEAILAYHKAAGGR